MIKLKTKTYLFIISFVFTSCVILGFAGICVCYENIMKTAYGQDKAAVSIDGGGIRILDFEFSPF